MFKKILVTGGAGFIGSHLVDALIVKGYKVIIIDDLSLGFKENINKKAKFYKVDICSSKIYEIFKKEKPDVVFHLAAIPRVPVSVQDPVLTTKVNILGTVNVFKTAIDSSVEKIIFASSSSVYGDQKKLPLKENMIPNPISPYALQKYTGEQFAKIFTNLFKVPIVSLRYFNVYGPRINFNSEYSLVIGKFLKLKKEGKPLTIYGNGNQTRGFCYVADVVGANILAMESKKIKGGEVINIGSEKSYSINYLAKLIGGKVKYLPPRPGDVLHTKADINLAKKLLGWQPKISFEEGIKKTIEYFEEIEIFKK
jgi:UDP-glucose 4-epimerase